MNSYAETKFEANPLSFVYYSDCRASMITTVVTVCALSLYYKYYAFACVLYGPQINDCVPPVQVIFCLFSFITGSYDRTCKVWETASGEELLTLEGHKNVIYSIAFNNPYGYE